jgi:hypothetical protein
MTTPTCSWGERQPRDVASWAQQVWRLKVRDLPSGALNLHVEGCQVVGPLQGFGHLWQNIYRVRLSGSAVRPREGIKPGRNMFPSAGCHRASYVPRGKKQTERNASMTTPSPEQANQPRDTVSWAQQAAVLKVERVPTGALNLNVEGHAVLSPLQGFGQLWQKVYQARVQNAPVTPAEMVRVWKEHFPHFWPQGNRFYAPATGITPGAVAILSFGMPRVPASFGMISTGVFVLYADEESFTFMTPTGHLFASWITFSVYQEEDWTVIQIHMLLRPNDPLYELGMRLRVIPFFEDRFWSQTLGNLLAHFNLSAPVKITATCIDKHVQWSQAGNIWQNAAVRTAWYTAMTPLRWIRRRVRGRKERDKA